ncbi:MAG: glycosyltransferase [Thermoplasmatales archaeon]
MKVLVFNNCAPSLKGGGAERTYFIYCETLVEIGFEVYAVFPDRFLNQLDNGYKFRIKTFSDSLNISGYTLSFVTLNRVIREINPDILHLLDGLTPTDLLIIILNKLLIKKPLYIDAIALYRNPAFNMLVRLQMPIYNLADGIAVSNPNLKKTLRHCLVKPAKILDYNPLFIDIQKAPVSDLREKKKAFNFIFIGVLDDSHSYKGLDLLLNLFLYLKRLETKNQNIILSVIGGGAQLDYYKSLALKYDLNNIIFKGYVSNLQNEFKDADALILPSKRRGEGFGKVILEALMQNVPVLVSEFAGGSYLVKEFNVGRTFNPYNPKMGAKVLLEFYQECTEGRYEKNIRDFQGIILAERDKSLNSITQMYKRSSKRVLDE